MLKNRIDFVVVCVIKANLSFRKKLLEIRNKSDGFRV